MVPLMRTFTRLVMVAVVALSIFASVPAAMAVTPGGSFLDDDGNPHEGYIEAIAALGITQLGGRWLHSWCAPSA